jgi:molybdopterin converting factor small subunit
MVSILVKALGGLKELIGDNSHYLIEEGMTLKDLFTDIMKDLNYDSKMELNNLIKGNLRDFLILINGSEVSLLQGLNTKIKAGDEVVLIPISHGG